MCGIAGIRYFDNDQVSLEHLQTMAGMLNHRGPDDRGFWRGPGIGFAHTRLSIIDLAASHQPMISADQRWVLVFNGEIFNYRQLRAKLAYPFTTDGDTEVLLAGISLHGIEFVDELIGQFAFAAHDLLTGMTHLVRDRLGVLPLHYALSRGGLVFGSEIKAVLAGLTSRPAVDLHSLDAYLFGRSVPAPHTLFDGISKLPQGSRAEIDPNGNAKVIRYWTPPPPDATGLWTEADAVEAVDRAITNAVDAALVADVPVGAYLSGGVDSSLIVAKIAALRPGAPLETFSAGFGDPRNDELPWARMVSAATNSHHHEIHVDANDFESLWPKLTWHRDAPISEPADIAVFRLAQSAREHVRVVLSGEGGDELFAGYPKYRVARTIALAARMPASLRSALIDPVEQLTYRISVESLCDEGIAAGEPVPHRVTQV